MILPGILSRSWLPQDPHKPIKSDRTSAGSVITQPGMDVLHHGHDMHLLKRRGLELGWICEDDHAKRADEQTIVRVWHDDAPVFVSGLVVEAIGRHADDIKRARQLMEKTLTGFPLADLLQSAPVANRLLPHFALVTTSMEEHEAQGIEKLYFDARDDDQYIAEDLWCKASWLSFYDGDASLRFRFSFGMEAYEDVAADPVRQHWAGVLCDRIFPESAVITQNTAVSTLLREIFGVESACVERIVYFNAPNGGAQFHHDVERGHAGVIYAQITGRTFWLALSKPRLMDEIVHFLARADANTWRELRKIAASRDALSAHMDESDHEAVEALIDRDPAFIRYMIEQGHSFLLHPGDVLLMPQRDIESCVWHCVFCLDDEPGEGLSFALRETAI